MKFTPPFQTKKTLGVRPNTERSAGGPIGGQLVAAALRKITPPNARQQQTVVTPIKTPQKRTSEVVRPSTPGLNESQQESLVNIFHSRVSGFF